MWWRWALAALLVTAVAGRGKKNKHHKPGRAVFDRLSSTIISEVPAPSENEGLLPAPLDVAPYASVAANATCGARGAEEFCRDTPGKRGVVCDVCEGDEGSSSRRHPAAFAVDGDPSTWWQSPTFSTGEEYHHVDLIATMPGKMDLLHVIIKCGPSPRPLAWSLEVSPTEGGEDWRLIRAFADRDHCRKIWDLRPERRRRKARGTKRSSQAENITCSTQFANMKPLENGEMHVGIGEGVAARRVRVSFRAAHDTTYQYYTIREMTLAARCLCHGHAARCAVDRKSVKCDCLHGTCGFHCQRCCSGAAWLPHQPCNPGESEKTDCSCGERGACSYDDTGAILCVNCTDNRAGPLCDKCLLGYYNTVSDGPCAACDCDTEGSHGTCKWDKKKHRVACDCRPGYSGALCHECEDPNAAFPNCVLESTTALCKCDPRGVVDPTRVCDDVCECKAHVVGERCDTCAAGYFGLSAALPMGCRPCYCSHMNTHCAGDPEPGQDVVLPLGESWLICDNATSETFVPSVDDQQKPYVISYEIEGWDSFYWLSTTFSGDQLSIYGGEIQANLFWSVARGDSGGNPTVGPDFILLAQDGTRLWYGNSSHESAGAVKLSAYLLEDRWYSESEPVSRIQLLDTLRDLRGMLIRAHYHFDQDEVRLEGVEVKGSPAGVREVCTCPPGYEGAQCTRCAWTHARLLRAPGSAPAFECVPCACNMHAACGTVEGACGVCAHNTTGPHCERCLPGHYGNPVQGACKPCACPLYEATNNFSPNCALASTDGEDFVCTQCPDGYTGDHCEICDSGYWGSPTTVGESCAACDCGGGPCHPTTGRCLVCPPHAEGERCDQCQEGYWAGGESGSCVSCACGPGALSAACELRSGRCACHPAWTGRACSECAAGYGDVEAGCPACRCGAAAVDPTCSPQTGACACAAGAAAPHCDTCQPDHYGFTVDGCTSCNCSVAGSESNACDIRSGQCRCKPYVTGRACDTCEEGYWGLEMGGCRRCECGVGAAACDPVSGLCACAAGVGGARCDRCLPGYYGFGPTGCLICPTCTDGRVCSPVTGRCVCPGRTRGPNCKQCARGYWRRSHACVPCACGPGSLAETCDVNSGQCHCRLGWTGPACDRCAPGYFGPRCRPCNCMPAGTRDCDRGVCACDQDGQCPCKENVEGEKCDSCLEGTFGLTETNPVGCTACFCFGRSAQCTQADVIRAALHASTPVHLKLLRGDIKTMDQDSLLAVHTKSPDATISVPWPAVPVYVELGELFLGDHLLSYGGALRFRVEEEGGEPLPSHTLSKFPLVSIYGAHLVLDYYQRIPGVNGTHAAHLHESLWEVRGRGAAASRSALMLVLQDVRRLLLRVSSRAPTKPDPVHVLLLSASLETAVAGVGRGASAPGVERCDCPREYDAASCQQPAPGFWMPPATPRVLRVSGTVVIRLDGGAQPCDCRGRANTCDARSGHCLNCTDYTAGSQCERCADGYYGSPETGCLPCPCPGPTRNNAAACSVNAGRVYCYCKPGYTGAECETCAAGWRAEGGACVACTCDPRGAVVERCDASARCHCRAHATGERCQRCSQRRHYLDNDGCKPCDNCTQTLLDSIEGLTEHFNSRVDILELNRVPQPFPAIREFSHNASLLQQSLQSIKKNFEKFRLLEMTLNNLEKGEHEFFTNANKFKEEASKREKEAGYLSLESMTGLDEVLKQKRLIANQVALLDDFARGEKHLSAHRALKEARHLLKKIKDMSLIDYVTSATDVSDSVNLQSTSVHEYRYRVDDALRRLQNILHGLDLWETKADDLPKLAEVVWTAGDTMMELRKNVIPRLTTLRDTGLKCRLVWEDITNLSSHNMTEDSRSALLQGRNLAISFPKLLSELRTLNAAAEEKEGILYNITPAYKEKYLDSVEKHAAILSTEAKEYKNLFAGTKAVASAGVQAARAWTEVAEGVRQAGVAANAAATAANTAGKLTRGPQPLLHTAEQEKLASQELKKKGVQVLERAEDLRRSVESARRGTDAVSVGLRALGWQQRELTTAAGGAGVGATAVQSLRQATAQAERVFGGARALYDEAAETRRKIRYQLRRELTHLQRLGDTALGAAEEHVSQIRGNTVRGAEVAEALAAAAEARAREHATAARQLSPKVRDLRTRIQRARDAAATISVSVTSPISGAGCARAYLAWSAPAATRASLAFSFDGTVRDGTLLYLPEQDTDRYLRLYVKGGRLRAKWDVGSGVGVVEHPEPLRATHDDADHAIYRVEIERVWGTVRLRVERAGSAAMVSTNSTSGSVGGLLRASRWWLGEADKPLPACVHALHCDRTHLGLWAFDTQPPTARCTGCTQRWYSGSRGSDGLVWFNGAGYVALRRSTSRPSDRRRFSLSFTFRTLDHDALLFLALDTVNNRSVSVWIRSCRVVFRVQYAHARLDIAAGARHCDGKPAHVQATRLFTGLERGSLRVNGEETLGSPSPPVQLAAELPELSEAQYWIGGVPPGSENIGFETPALLGCVGALTVDREGYDLLDTHARQGVESGCSTKPLRSAILVGKGFMELPSPIIKRKAVLGLTFQSRAESGILLYRAPSIHGNEVNEDDDDKNYLLLMLVKGELEVLAHAGKGSLRLRLNGTRLNDGRLHSLRVVRAHKQLEVWVDEEQLAAGTLPGVVYAARPRGLYLGGAPTDHGGPDLPAGPFVGTVADLIADSTWIGFEEALEWEGVRLGRADGELRPDPPAEPRALQAQPDPNSMCTKTSSYTVEAGAVKFGDVPGSYATLRVGRSGAKGELSIGLHIRTFAAEGLILIIPGSKAKPKHYTALMVKEGHLKLVVRGRKRRELILPLFVADGTWRSVSVRAGRRRVVLRCGSAATETRAAALARAARLYVGGPPPAPQLPHLPPAILRVGGFVGCIRRVMVNGRQEDLVGDARSHTAVGQCFPHIERGAYFAGDAYAVWSGKWWSEETEAVEVRLQFKTHAPNGVLLAAGGVVLELRDGAVVVSGPGGRGAAVEAGARACDGAWHAVRARLARRPTLALDAAPEERAPPALLPAPEPPARAYPLYVAGLPEGASELMDGRENFKGCIRDLVVGNQKRNWTAFESLHNVLLDSCPVTQ